jgi:hypothetical protein
MKMSRILIIFFCVFSLNASAQYDSKGERISRFRPGFMWFNTGWRPAAPEKVRKYDRLIFDVTYNDWMGDRDLFQNNWASIGLNTNLMFDIPLAKGNKVALGIGVAHQLMKIRHDNHLIGDELSGTTTFLAKDTNDNFTKSIFGTNSFSVPIELRFRNESWKHFKFHIGGKIGYQVNAFSKYVGTVDGNKEISKRIGFPDENQLIYSAHVRLGLRNWALYGSYNFNTLFSNANSIQLNAVQFGLSISLF